MITILVEFMKDNSQLIGGPNCVVEIGITKFIWIALSLL